MAQRGPETPREAQRHHEKGPERLRETQSGPETQRSRERPRKALKGPFAGDQFSLDLIIKVKQF